MNALELALPDLNLASLMQLTSSVDLVIASLSGSNRKTQQGNVAEVFEFITN
jgi:hypothetical protein